MSSNNNNKLLSLKENVFTLIEYIGKNIANHVNNDRVNPQDIYALTKLIDSFLKLNEVEALSDPSKDKNQTLEAISEEDKAMLTLYRLKIEEVAPRAGLEPATKRLTAACSTTELPGNNE